MKVEIQKDLIRSTKGTLPAGTVMDLDPLNANRLASLGVVKIIEESEHVTSKPGRRKKTS